MANLSLRLTDNVPGRFYVDSSCIDCQLCVSLVPSIFAAMNDEGYCIVHRQPANDQELELALRVMEDCPVGAIGDEGLSA